MTENQVAEQRYAYSKLTDTWYLVREWKVLDAEKGHILAKDKEEVDREEVPQHWLDGVEER
jgi:hypothetical protein